jgi:hypothetical protein
MIEHNFTPKILEIISSELEVDGKRLLEASPILEYLNIKTKSASKGSKSRGSFANHYAIYVLTEDYVNGDFHNSGKYTTSYDGAKFTDLLTRQRELPFGAKLQNHALNHRMNQEYRKYFPTSEYVAILRNADTNRYWINENLLKVELDGNTYNIAHVVLKVIDAYVDAKRDAFEGFISTCKDMQNLQIDDPQKVLEFINGLLEPNVDARVFEIVSFSILKEYYSQQSIFWGWNVDSINEEFLALFKTGRCNANDGGIDFVMKPLGRLFQVTETTDVKKYFLDIDKVQRYPVTFVVKSSESEEDLVGKIKKQAQKVYAVEEVVNKYMGCVEEVINIPTLISRFNELVEKESVEPVIDEILQQSKVEFNYQEEKLPTED